jgi:hypothetical protein
MSDQSAPLPLFVHTYTQLAACNDLRHLVSSGTFNCATNTAVANLAAFIPVYLPWPYPVARVFWVNGSAASSNVNFGIFRKNGRRLYSTGSTAQSGNSVPQFVTPTPFTLTPGEYFFAIATDGTTNRLSGTIPGIELLKMAGVLAQASNFALADPSAPTTAVTGTHYTYCGVTRTASGF